MSPLTASNPQHRVGHRKGATTVRSQHRDLGVVAG